MLEKDSRSLAFLLSKTYHKPTIPRIPKPPIIRTIKEKVWVEVPIQKEIRVRVGGFSWGTFLLVSSIGFVATLVVGSGNITLPGLIISIILGLAAAKIFPKTERQTVEETQKVQQEIIRKVKEDQDPRDEVIPASTKAIAFGRLKIAFKAISIDENRVVVFGPTKVGEETRKFYPTIKDVQRYYELNSEMNSRFKEVPHILKGEKGVYPLGEKADEGSEVALWGFEKELEDSFLKMESIFGDQTDIPIRISWIKSPDLYHYLARNRSPIKKGEESQSLVSEDYQAVLDIHKSEGGLQLEDSIKEWIDLWALNHAILHGLRFSSLSTQVAPIFFDYGNLLNYSAFNFYCPLCNNSNVEDILNRSYSVQSDNLTPPVHFSKNTRCIYELQTGSWRCPTCGAIIENPIPIHKSLDEILLPTFDRLMAENKTERLKAHSDARTKEIGFNNEMEKELEKAFYDQVSLILSLANDVEKMKAEILGEGEAINSIQEVVQGYGKSQSSVLERIQKYSEAIRFEIQKRTDEVLAEVDRFKDHQMNILEEKLFRLSKVKRLDDERRDAIQREIVSAQKEMIIAQRNQTAAIADGFNRTTSAIHKQIEETQVGFQTINKSVHEQTNATRSGFRSLDASLSRNNAIQVAVAKKQGVNPNDYCPILNPIRAMKDLGTDITKIGKSAMEKEKEKLSHAK